MVRQNSTDPPHPVGLYIIPPRWQLIRSLPSLFSLLTTIGSLPIFPLENATPSKYFSVFGLDTCYKQNQYDALFVIFRYHLDMDRQGVKEVLGVKKGEKAKELRHKIGISRHNVILPRVFAEKSGDRYSQEFLRFNQKGYLSVVSGDYNRLNLIQRQFNPLTPKSD